MGGACHGTTLEGWGTWSLDGERVHHTNGERSGTLTVRIEGSRLRLDPDFALARDESMPISSEYERLSET